MAEEWTAGGLSSFLDDVCTNEEDDDDRQERYRQIISAALVGIFRQLEIMNEGNNENN